MRRLVRFVVRAGLGFGVVAVGVATWLFWRLERGPLPLDFLVPRIEAEFGGDDPSSAVHLDGLDLSWSGLARHVELRARGFRVGPPGTAPAAFDAVRLKLRARSFLRGKAYVQGIEVDGLRLQLVRDANDRLTLQARTEAGEVRELANVWTLVRRLETFTLQAGRIDYIDEPSGTRWVVPQLDARLWRDGDQVRGEAELAIVSGEKVIPVSIGVVYGARTGAVEVRGGSSGADTAAAFQAWPSTMAREAHAWVTSRIQGGRIADVRCELAAHALPGEGGRLAVDAFHASVRFEDLAVRFLDTMPAVAGVDGEARFSREDVVVDVAAGAGLDGVSVGPARVQVAWPDEAPNRIAIRAKVDGPLSNVVAVLDHEPVGLGAALDLPTRGIGGRVEGHVALAFPLAHPEPGKLGLRATGTIAGASAPQLAGDWEMADGTFALDVTDRAVALDGTATLRGAPVRVTYRERFATPSRRRLAIAGRLDREHRRTLGIDPGDWLDGPVDARVRIAPNAEGRTRAAVDMDLEPAAVEIPALRVTKVPGSPGRGLLRLGIARGVVTAVERGTLRLPGLTATGSAARPPGGGAWSHVDATVELVSTDPSADPLDVPPPTEVELRAEDHGWRAVVRSPDVGRLVRHFGVETVRGGRATFEGVVDLAGAGLPLEGDLTVENVTLSRVPWLMKLVSLASIRGLLDIGGPQSVDLDRVVGRIGHRPPVVVLMDATARGPKLSLTLAGTVDHGADVLDLQGTLVPSYYLLNEGAARIPVLGPVIERATGGAVQAFDFTVKGTRAEPVVSVQPLSSMAPGMLREWLRKLGL